ATGPIRPSGHPRPPGYPGPAGDPRRARAREAVGRRGVGREPGTADARLFGRRPGKPGERSRDPRRPTEQKDGWARGVERGDRPRDRGTAAKEPGYLRPRADDDGVPRGRTRAGGADAAEFRPGPQGFDRGAGDDGRLYARRAGRGPTVQDEEAVRGRA